MCSNVGGGNSNVVKLTPREKTKYDNMTPSQIIQENNKVVRAYSVLTQDQKKHESILFSRANYPQNVIDSHRAAYDRNKIAMDYLDVKMEYLERLYRKKQSQRGKIVQFNSNG